MTDEELQEVADAMDEYGDPLEWVGIAYPIIERQVRAKVAAEVQAEADDWAIVAKRCGSHHPSKFSDERVAGQLRQTAGHIREKGPK